MTKRLRSKSGDTCLQEMKRVLAEFESKKRKMETNGDGVETTVGNTKESTVAPNSGKPRTPQYKHFDMTWYGYKNGDMETIRSVMEPLCDVFVFQEEIGKKSGKAHLQCCFSLKKRARYQEFGLPKETSWRKVRNLTECRIYCSKLDTRKPGTTPHTFNYTVPGDRLIDEDYIYPNMVWQQEVIRNLSVRANDRNIYWYWSEIGENGKSTLSNHLIDKMRGRLIGGTCPSDIYYHLACINKTLKRNDILIYDLSREESNKLSYTALEKIKDRNLFCSKYESKDFKVPVLHIVVFANNPPIYEKLTKGRLIIRRIEEIPNWNDRIDNKELWL
jgi:Putative viral replication protein.